MAETALLAVGLSHRTAPVSVRERLALDEDVVRRHLHRLRDERVVDEVMLLSTCNRVELYAVPHQGAVDLKTWFHAFRGPKGERIEDYLYWHEGEEAVRHLFRVASSLDSLVVGEPQILGQVKTAVRLAEDTGSMGRVLTKLAHQTLSVAKRVRTQTDIGRYRVGVGNAGVDLATQIFGTLRGRRALLVGTGEMGRQVGRALLSAGLEELVVVSHSYERAVEVAGEFGGTPIAYDRLESYLERVDVVIAATTATRPVLDVPVVKRAVKARFYKPMFLVDLAVPRNIDPAVSDAIDEVYLFNIDDLSKIVMAGREAREAAAEAAEAMVADEATRFTQRLAEVDVGRALGTITRHAEQVRAEELDRTQKLVDALDDGQRQALDAMTKAMMKKVLHEPLLAIRKAAREGDAEALRAILRSWGIEDE